MKIVIYGAQGVALGANNAIKILHPEIKIECFLVTAMGNNASILGGIPVRELKEFVAEKTDEEKKNIEVLIGTPENVMEAIEKSLDKVGIHNHVRLDSMRWAEMQEKAFIRKGCFTPMSTYPIGSNKANIEMYKMLHYKDKQLCVDYELPNYLIPVQVGAAISSNAISISLGIPLTVS